MPLFKGMKNEEAVRDFSPTISFIVPLFNKENEVVKCLETLFNFAAEYDGFVEIFVIDNGSQDHSYEIAYATTELNKRRNPRVRTKVLRLTTRLPIPEVVNLCSKFTLGQKIALVKCEKGKAKAKTIKTQTTGKVHL